MLAEPFDVDGRRPHGRPRRHGGGGVLRVAAEGAPGLEGRERARRGELQRAGLPRRRRRRALLRRGVRMEAAPAARAAPCGCSPATATTSRRPRRGSRSRWPGWARRTASSTSSPSSCRSRRATRHAAALERHLRHRRRRGHRGPATRARRRGRSVGPVDAPWVRMAVIRDPQGATFIASQFVPENATTG